MPGVDTSAPTLSPHLGFQPAATPSLGSVCRALHCNGLMRGGAQLSTTVDWLLCSSTGGPQALAVPDAVQMQEEERSNGSETEQNLSSLPRLGRPVPNLSPLRRSECFPSWSSCLYPLRCTNLGSGGVNMQPEPCCFYSPNLELSCLQSMPMPPTRCAKHQCPPACQAAS